MAWYFDIPIFGAISTNLKPGSFLQGENPSGVDRINREHTILMGIYNILRTNCPGINVGKGTKPTGVVNNFMYDIWFEQTGHINLPDVSGGGTCNKDVCSCGKEEANVCDSYGNVCGGWRPDFRCPGGPGAACETDDNCLFDELHCVSDSNTNTKTCQWTGNAPATATAKSPLSPNCNWGQTPQVEYGKGPLVMKGKSYPDDPVCSSECQYTCTS